MSTAEEMRVYINEHTDFSDIGNRMLQEWEQSAKGSLRA